MVKASCAEAIPERDARANVLIVDDDDIFATTAGRILRQAGYGVKVAGTFRIALDVLDGEEPLDLMITDLVMPRQVNGIALSRMARMRRKGLKVIYVTGYDIPGDAEAQAVGPILRKPIHEEELVGEVGRLLAAN